MIDLAVLIIFGMVFAVAATALYLALTLIERMDDETHE